MRQTPRSADEAQAMIDAGVAAAQEKARRATEFRQTLDAIRGSGTVGGVRVELDSAGGLRDLELPDQLEDRSGRRLRDDIMAAVRAAQLDVAQNVRRQVREAFGEDSGVTRHLDAEVDQRFGPA